MPILRSSRYLKVLPIILSAAWLSISSCSTTRPPTTGTVAAVTPTAIGSVSTTPGNSSVITATAPVSLDDKIGQAAIAGWEEMFRTLNSYEYVRANGRPDDKAWWIEQSQRFYTGKALASQLQYIEYIFSPRSLGSTPAFIENARYTVSAESCQSDTECAFKVHVESGTFWAYDVHAKSWQQANSIEPTDWAISMQYDPAAGRWKIK